MIFTLTLILFHLCTTILLIFSPTPSIPLTLNLVLTLTLTPTPTLNITLTLNLILIFRTSEPSLNSEYIKNYISLRYKRTLRAEKSPLNNMIIILQSPVFCPACVYFFRNTWLNKVEFSPHILPGRLCPISPKLKSKMEVVSFLSYKTRECKSLCSLRGEKTFMLGFRKWVRVYKLILHNGE